jgi:hypothetical protein
MRIQETNAVLKEARSARHGNVQQQEETGVMSRAWRMVSSKLEGLFSRKH